MTRESSIEIAELLFRTVQSGSSAPDVGGAGADLHGDLGGDPDEAAEDGPAPPHPQHAIDLPHASVDTSDEPVSPQTGSRAKLFRFFGETSVPHFSGSGNREKLRSFYDVKPTSLPAQVGGPAIAIAWAPAFTAEMYSTASSSTKDPADDFRVQPRRWRVRSAPTFDGEAKGQTHVAPPLPQQQSAKPYLQSSMPWLPHVVRRSASAGSLQQLVDANRWSKDDDSASVSTKSFTYSRRSSWSPCTELYPNIPHAASSRESAILSPPLLASSRDYAQSPFLRNVGIRDACPAQNLKSRKKIMAILGDEVKVDVPVEEVFRSGLDALLGSCMPLCYFLAFLLTEGSAEMLLFALDMKEFAETGFASSRDAVHAAKTILQTYLDPNAVLFLSEMSSQARVSISESLDQPFDDSAVLGQFFAAAMTDADEFLRAAFARFADSDLGGQMQRDIPARNVVVNEESAVTVRKLFKTKVILERSSRSKVLSQKVSRLLLERVGCTL
ncbi:hypothetical protein DFJ73DRAFT_824564 [Zopfochytrium polystomum]|nr:hypothetical protein DFJ73DRAFT_824564 [Zopfochytrium polystomum]